MADCDRIKESDGCGSPQPLSAHLASVESGFKSSPRLSEPACCGRTTSRRRRGAKELPETYLFCIRNINESDPLLLLLLPANSDKREEEDVTSGLGLRKPRTRTRARPSPLARVAFCSTREESRSGLGRSPSHSDLRTVC